MRSPNTPGPAGYAMAVVIAFAWNATFLAGGMIGEGVGGAIAGWVAVFALSVFFRAPLAIGGVLAVHLTCRRVRAQWVHVVAAGAVGAAGSALLYPWLVVDGIGILPASIGIAAALGRLGLVPYVDRGRARLASSAPLRVL